MLCPLHLFQLGCRRQIGCGEEGEGGGREGAGEDGLKEGGAEEVFVFGERAGEEVELGFVPGSSGFFGRGAGCAGAGAGGSASGGGGGGGRWMDIFKRLEHGTLDVGGVAGRFFFSERVRGRWGGEEGVEENRQFGEDVLTDWRESGAGAGVGVGVFGFGMWMGDGFGSGSSGRVGGKRWFFFISLYIC